MESFLRELTPEDEARIINQIAREVIKRELITPAIIFLESVRPVSRIGSQMAMVFVGPYLTLFGDMGMDYIKFFDKPENVERLLRRIEEEAKIITEEKNKAKEQEKLISKTFDLRLDLQPGFSLREETTRGEPLSGTISIMRKESIGGGYVALSFETIESSSENFLDAISDHFDKKDMRQALSITDDTILKKSDSRQSFTKIRGHKASMNAYKWSGPTGQSGEIECYGLWCDKTRRFIVLAMRTGPSTGKKDEKDQVRELRFVLGSLKCH